MLAEKLVTAEETVAGGLATGVVTALDDSRYVVDGRRACRRAAACLLEPQPGDTVLCYTGDDGCAYVLSVLERACPERALLSVAGANAVGLHARRLDLSASRNLRLSTLRHMQINAALGTLQVNARDLFTTVSNSLVQAAQNYIGKMTQYSLRAAGLLRQHGRHQVVTADQDVRIDGERITMG